MKILVVDDDPSVVELLPVILANEGFRNVHCFMSAEEGLAAVKEPHSSFDCLILDINMPGMNGIELCERVRSLANYRNVPIVMLTSLRDDETVRAALRAGATDYITKPFDVLQIGVRIQISAKIAQANNSITRRFDLKEGGGSPQSAKTFPVTRKEIMNMFSDDLYGSKKR